MKTGNLSTNTTSVESLAEALMQPTSRLSEGIQDTPRYWQRSSRADPIIARLADDHYSRQTQRSRQFTPPGQVIILYIPGTVFRAAAGWAWHRPAPGKATRLDGYDGFYNCSFFRNESTLLSSDLIKEAIQWAIEIWGKPEHGFDTYVMPARIRSSNPGYCYQMAGWQKDGWSKDGLKRRLYLAI